MQQDRFASGFSIVLILMVLLASKENESIKQELSFKYVIFLDVSNRHENFMIFIYLHR